MTNRKYTVSMKKGSFESKELQDNVSADMF